MSKTGYKFIGADMHSKNGECKWTLGEWKKYDGKLEMCKAGFHFSEIPLDSLKYIYGDRWFAIEARGKILKDGDKSVASEMRLVREIDVKKVLVKFAIICAKECLPEFEKIYKEDKRPRQAIEAAENYLKNPCEETVSAAKSAAWSAWSAAKSAAWSAGSAAKSAVSAKSAAAWSAESAAAWSAAESAVSAKSAAAWSAESAVSAAESAAAWSAESAVSAAESAAAWSAESAAGSAESAAKKWQNKRLLELTEEDALSSKVKLA